MTKKETVKDRLILFIEELGIGKSRFEKSTKLSNGYVNNLKESIGANKLEYILSVYPQLNSDWLLTGEGSMLKEGNKREEPKEFISEVIPVPEEAYMMVEYADLSASAGYLGGGDVNVLPEQSRRLLPREYERGHYLVVRVSGDSMNDGTARSLFDGDEILVKQVYMDSHTKSLPIRKSLFVITSRDGNVLKQITEFNYEEGYLVCHSFNPNYSDFRIQLEDVYQIFQVCKIVQKQISLM